MIYLIFALPFLCRIKRDDTTEVCSKENGLYLRGLATLMIVLHHLCLSVNGSGILLHVGHLASSIFFFLSGYGLMKKKDLNGFWKKRLSAVYVPFVVANAIFIFARMLSHEKISLFMVICWLFGFILIDSFKWFIIVLLLCYFLYYLCFKCMKQNQLVGMFLFLTGYLILCLKMHTLAYWYIPIYTFWVGMMFEKYEKIIMENLNKYYTKWCVVFGGTFAFCMYRMIVNTNTPLEMFSTFVFLGCMILFCMKLRFASKYLLHLGKISYSVYLMQHLPIAYLPRNNQVLYLICSFISILILGELLHLFLQKIKTKP